MYLQKQRLIGTCITLANPALKLLLHNSKELESFLHAHIEQSFYNLVNDLSAEVQIEIKGQDLVLLPVRYSKVHFSTFRYFHGYFYFSNKLFDIH